MNYEYETIIKSKPICIKELVERANIYIND